MNAAEHYAEAERLLTLHSTGGSHFTELAQVHATLALAGAVILTNNVNIYTDAHHDLAERVAKATAKRMAER